MRKKMLFVSPGPALKVNASRFKSLSQYFSGTVITSSAKEEVINVRQVADFNYRCIRFNLKQKVLTNIKFVLFAVYFSIKERLKGDKYDLVKTYDPLKSGIIGVIAAALLRSKLVVEVNGVYTSSAEYMDGAEKLSVRLKKIVYPIIERQVLKRADGIKLLFPGQVDPFKAILDGKVIRWFPNLVDIDKFISLPLIEEKIVLFVGFPFKRKGVDILIDAFKKIAPSFPDWKLEILGWFLDPEILQTYINGHPQIYHHLPVMPDEMPERYKRCAIFVLPSRSEAMGRVLLEAMAAGKPRIGSNVDGIPMVINDGVDGLLCEPENVEDLANKLDLLMGDSALRKKMGVAGRKRAKKEFSEEVYMNNLVNFYNDVIKS